MLSRLRSPGESFVGVGVTHHNRHPFLSNSREQKAVHPLHLVYSIVAGSCLGIVSALFSTTAHPARTRLQAQLQLRKLRRLVLLCQRMIWFRSTTVTFKLTTNSNPKQLAQSSSKYCRLQCRLSLCPSLSAVVTIHHFSCIRQRLPFHLSLRMQPFLRD